MILFLNWFNYSLVLFFAIISFFQLGIAKNGIWGIECQYKNKPSITLKAPSPSGPLPICPK